MSLDTKEKLNSYIEREQLAPVLNDTKWQKLFDQLALIENYYLSFRRKDLDQDEPKIWSGDLHENFGLWRKIEWIEIQTSEAHIHKLKSAIENSGVPYSVGGNIYRIWGYLRPGATPAWANT